MNDDHITVPDSRGEEKHRCSSARDTAPTRRTAG